MSGSTRQSPFFRDLTSPVPSYRTASRFATPGQAAAVSALRRENLAAISDIPPPPVFTLDDRAEFSPEPGLAAVPPSPSPRTPPPPPKVWVEDGMGGTAQQSPSGVPSWLSPAKGSEDKAKGRGSPVNGVVQSGALVMLPPPREVVRPEAPKSSLPTGGLDEEEWVTVYGFFPGDINLVLREFEKCGLILKHVLGPRDANWMHILYQNRYDAQKALQKNGMHINSVLIVGVKPVDHMQRQYLDAKINSSGLGGFTASLHPLSANGRSSDVFAIGGTSRPSYLKASTTATADSKPKSNGAIASPAKSVVSKVMDLMFGV
ncbi:putative RNA-recognition motif (RRM) domain, nucleoporin, NUP53 [Dioscorea sansibarensis]